MEFQFSVLSLLAVPSYFVLNPSVEAVELPSATVGDEGDLVPNKDLESVCKILKTVDQELTEMNKDPPENGGSELMKKLHTYNQAALYLLHHCKNDQINAFNAAKEMLEQGGPDFMMEDMDENTMKDRFQWDEEALQKLHEAVKRTNIVWYDLFRIYNKIPIPGDTK